MKKIGTLLFLVFAILSCGNFASAQMPVEVFGGHQKATFDLMFFKYFIFNRNRLSVDYAMTSTSTLPQFGFTEAVSYNHKKLKGFAPVVVASILNKGVYPKAGIQFAKVASSYIPYSAGSSAKRSPIRILIFSFWLDIPLK